MRPWPQVRVDTGLVPWEANGAICHTWARSQGRLGNPYSWAPALGRPWRSGPSVAYGAIGEPRHKSGIHSYLRPWTHCGAPSSAPPSQICRNIYPDCLTAARRGRRGAPPHKDTECSAHGRGFALSEVRPRAAERYTACLDRIRSQIGPERPPHGDGVIHHPSQPPPKVSRWAPASKPF